MWGVNSGFRCVCELLHVWKRFWLNQLLFKLELRISFVCLSCQMYSFYFYAVFHAEAMS